MPRLLARLLALALLALPAAAGAAPTEGERLFREGRAAMQEKDYEVACARFAESQRKEPAPGTSLNLGECEERRAHLLAAREAFASAAAAFASGEKKSYAAGRADALDKRIPRVVVRVAGAPKGAVVHLGERVVEPGVELRLDPGDVVFTVDAPASRTKRVPVTLKESHVVVEIDLGPLDLDVVAPPQGPTIAATPATQQARPSNGLRILGYSLGGVGLASLVVGTVTGIMALDRASTVKDHCDGDLACDPDGTSAARSGRTLSLVSTITVIVGVVGLGAGGLLLFTSRTKKVSTTMGAGPGDVGLMLRRSF